MLVLIHFFKNAFTWGAGKVMKDLAGIDMPIPKKLTLKTVTFFLALMECVSFKND